jgi:gas vesicle protein
VEIEMEKFEMEGPEKEQMEHHAVHGKDNFATKIAVLTACLATVGALCGYEGGKTLTEATLLKNEATIIKTEAADKWSFFQAKSIKQSLAENSAANAIDETVKNKFEQKAKDYNKEKTEIQEEAKKLEEKASELNKESEETIHHHHRWAQAMMALQIAISLAAITILTKKKWMFFTSLGVSIVGLGLTILGFLSM